MSGFDFLISVTGTAMAVLDAVEIAMQPESIGEWMDGPLENYLIKRVQERFNSQGDDASGKWPALSAYTIMDRLEQGYGEGPIEYRTGALYAYVQTGGVVNDNGAEVEYSFPGTAPSGELAIKLAVAQTGAKAHDGMGPTPARPVLAINDNDVEQILFSLSSRITDHINGVI